MEALGQITSLFFSFLTHRSEEWSLLSVPFFATFVAFFAIYILLCKQRQQAMQAYLIAFGLFFAFKANGTLMLLLPLTIITSWYLTEKMMRLRKGRPRQMGLVLLIAIELLPLIHYKYTNFGLSIINDIFGSNLSFSKLFLPIGISFYTFQAISYTVDVYRKTLNRRASLMEYTAYLTFFPLLFAGPIARAKHFIPQINQPRTTDKQLINKGLWLIICGLLKKSLIADYLVQFNDWVFADPTAFTGFENLMATLGYTLQIYCDFSGYSDIAIGLAALMGIELLDNFSFPYQSLNLTEFWHRWHISLSTWFRDYVYIPLGGSRKGVFRTCLNSFLTMVVAGLWHGASVMFVLWGCLHGAGLVVHKIACRMGLNKIPNTLIIRVVSWLLTFGFVSLAWVFFRSPNLSTALAMFAQIGSDFSLADFYPFLMTRPEWLILFGIGLELHSIRKHDYDWMLQKFIALPAFVKCLIFIAVLQLIINFSQNEVQPFIYTQF